MNTQYLIAPKEVQQVFMEYESMHVPYFISKRGKTIKPRLFKGKGAPDAIKEYVNGKSEATKTFLESVGVGIDCSGFVSYLIDAYSTNHSGKRVWELFQRKTINPISMLLFKIQPIVSMLDARTLTSGLNTIKIQNVEKAKPMDLIKMSGGRHVAMIYEIWKENDLPVRMSYIHSTEGVGVCKCYINISDPYAPITSQEFEAPEITPINDPGYLIRYHVNMNGIRRLKNLEY